MNCREFLDILHLHLDGAALPADSALEMHVRDCPACHARLTATRRLTDSFRLLRSSAPPPDLAPRISTAALRDIRRRRLVRRGALAGALAAGVLIALGGRLFLIADKPSNPAREVVKSTPAAPPATKSGSGLNPGPRPLRNAVEEAGQAVASLTSRTADEAVGQTRSFLPTVTGRSLENLEIQPPDPSAIPLRVAGQNFTAGLDPVANSARRAVDLFLHDIQPGGGQARGGL
jgi:hypothetical protein